MNRYEYNRRQQQNRPRAIAIAAPLTRWERLRQSLTKPVSLRDVIDYLNKLLPQI